MTTRPLPVLSMLEARVLAVLVEKERTVPDTYPMTLNAITAGCNQKSSRQPVIEASDTEVQAALDSLRHASLVIESSGGRAMRYAHNARRVLDIPGEAVALVATLVLRGPQTAGELRIHCERLHRFADIASVEGYLHELAARAAGPLVAELPRQPGARETRWASLLGGPLPGGPAPNETAPAAQTGASARVASGARAVPEGGASQATSAAEPTLGKLAALEANLARLERDVQALKATVARLCEELGVKT
ncbi:MAG: YceH family protein [Burkholderiaceae bacterium]|nr:YceH family protein [Burkholderiaceae bacterium]